MTHPSSLLIHHSSFPCLRREAVLVLGDAALDEREVRPRPLDGLLQAGLERHLAGEAEGGLRLLGRAVAAAGAVPVALRAQLDRRLVAGHAVDRVREVEDARLLTAGQVVRLAG